MLPSIGMPTTAGTGSEAQSYALISDAETHVKMACGDPKAAFRDRDSRSGADACRSRAAVTATAGYDAISHAVESFVTTRARTSPICSPARRGGCSRRHYERVLADTATI